MYHGGVSAILLQLSRPKRKSAKLQNKKKEQYHNLKKLTMQVHRKGVGGLVCKEGSVLDQLATSRRQAWCRHISEVHD